MSLVVAAVTARPAVTTLVNPTSVFSRRFLSGAKGFNKAKIETLEGRVGDEHLDALRRRRSALEDLRDSPVVDYDRPLSWGEIQQLAFSDR